MKPIKMLPVLIGLMAILSAGCQSAATTAALPAPTAVPPTKAAPAPTAVPPTEAAPALTAVPPTEAAPAPAIDPADFVAVIDNPYMPLVPGTTRIYETQTKNGTERVEVVVLAEKKVILGVTTTVVRDTVYLEGQVIEATYDWFAQDKAGNVWYFGEAVDNYKDGVLVDHKGAWEGGVDGAQPGIVMHSKPADYIGKTYRQEYYVGEAEDMAQVLRTTENATVAFGSFENLVQIKEWTPLEPGIVGYKYYASGIGLVLSMKVEGGSNRTELISVTTQAGTGELLPQPTSGFPPGIAPESARVDMVKPTFSNPTTIDNPLLPITTVDQLIQVGYKDGKPHRTEFTLLPGAKTIKWNGEQTEVRVLQFVAYLDGRILEHALDFLAQADGGAVWYFGEDVFNYQDGVIADYNGTWLAGKDGPPAMIMPASPQVGNVYRVENIPGNVFEEVTVKAINQTIEGPRGLIKGVIFVQQIGLDGKTTIKAFAPGYGEFLAHTENAAVAVPIDAISGPLPGELKTLLTGANSIFVTKTPENWDAASATLGDMTSAWDAYQTAVDLGRLFPLLDEQMARAINRLTAAVEQRDSAEARQAAFDVAIATLDLQMPYRPRTEIDLARFELWAQRVLVDSAAANPGDVAGDVVALELIWSRVGHTVDASKAKDIDVQLGKLRVAADAKDLTAASAAATALLGVAGG